MLQEHIISWTRDNLEELSCFYEQNINDDPYELINYWYLGLANLLQSREEEAQTIWMLGLSQLEEEDLGKYSMELYQIIYLEAEEQIKLSNVHNAWLLHQHLRILFPENINNVFKLILISLKINEYNFDLIQEWNLVELIEVSDIDNLNHQLLVDVIDEIIRIPNPINISVVRAALSRAYDLDDFITFITKISIEIAYKDHYPKYAAQILQVCLEYSPNHLAALHHISCFYSADGEHKEAILKAKHLYQIADTIVTKTIGSYLVMRALLTASHWQEIASFTADYKQALTNLTNTEISLDKNNINSGVFVSSFFLPYLADSAVENRAYQNSNGYWFQKNINEIRGNDYPLYQPFANKQTKKLKIGYIASTFRNHSVGWLSRWLFEHHNREQFEINLYLINQDQEDPFMQRFFRDKVDVTYTFPNQSETIAKQIKEDEINILIDADSLSYDITCEVMALKPAPVQATWLGWDASGIPAIDYYIADPYVLPDNAQKYYCETIWRLPETYIAVDGFEVGIPTLRRQDLDIPDDAVIFLSAQVGYKRHPNTIKWQLQIIKEVPNSYFLIKGIGDKEIIQDYFGALAAEVGVDFSRLRFLERDKDEVTHRANLTIADVVLDTYPYNGATTTLETLWMGIPIVTRVGEQFAARNSYTFMKNAGIEEGIAWTDEEYVEWGVRLGKDKALRWEIAAKLRASRQTSPLWDAKKFTKEMEKAYQQMWAKYTNSPSESNG